MPKLIFSWQKKEVDFEGSLLESFVENFPESMSDSELARALVRQGVKFPDRLPDPDTARVKRRDELWMRGDRQQRFALAEDAAFLRMLNEEQARGLLEKPDPELLKVMAKIIKRQMRGILSPAPRLSADTLIRFLIALIGAIEPEAKESAAEIESAVLKRLADEGATMIFTSKFPGARDFEIFDKGYYPQKYLRNPSLGIMQESLKTSIRMLLWRYTQDRQDILSTYRMRQRHGLTETVFMEVDGVKYPLTLEELLVICGYCDLEEEGSCLVEPLYATGEPLIRKAIIWTGLLSREQADAVWQTGDIAACRELLNTSFLFDLTDKQAEDIIAVNDLNMAESLACKIHYLYRDWDNIEEPRLSSEWRDKLRAYLEKHENENVRRLYVVNSNGWEDS